MWSVTALVCYTVKRPIILAILNFVSDRLQPEHPELTSNSQVVPPLRIGRHSLLVIDATGECWSLSVRILSDLQIERWCGRR